MRTIASGLRGQYSSAADLEGRKVLVVCNLKERTMGGFKSQGMILCASAPAEAEAPAAGDVGVANGVAGHVVRILEPSVASLPVGTRVMIGANGAAEPLSSSLLAKKKVLETLLPDFHTDGEGRAMHLTNLFSVSTAASAGDKLVFFASNPPLANATVA